tara:strand:+ start:460 stop:759 length:300 start_codon:yes stop_codon:yes gene_type:complete
MPSKKNDDTLSDHTENSTDLSYYSDSDYMPKQRYEYSWYDYNQEHILNLWSLITQYIGENGLNLLEFANVIHFTKFCHAYSYRKEFSERIHSSKNTSLN